MMHKKNNGPMAPVKPSESNPNRTSSQDSINDFLDKSQISSSNDIAAFLGKVKTMHSAGHEDRTGRIMFAMDATASREPSWDQACHLQSEMFLEAMNIIDYSLLVGIHKRDIFQTEQEQEELVTKLMVNKVCRYLDCYPIDDPC